MADLYPHKSNIGLMEPVALIGHNVCISYGSEKHFRRVKWFEPIPPFQCLDIGAIGAQTTSARTNAVNLNLFDEEFGQYRWYPLDNVQVRLWVPQTDGRFNLRNLQVPVDPTIVDRDPCLHLTEFFVLEDRTPAFEAINFMDYAITGCRIIAMGFRYVTDALPSSTRKAIEEGREACTYIVASGSPGRP